MRFPILPFNTFPNWHNQQSKANHDTKREMGASGTERKDNSAAENLEESLSDLCVEMGWREVHYCYLIFQSFFCNFD